MPFACKTGAAATAAGRPPAPAPRAKPAGGSARTTLGVSIGRGHLIGRRQALDQQIFAASPDAGDGETGERARKISRHRPAHAAMAYHRRADGATFKVGRDTAPGYFDFREFWHSVGL